jgi:hypothetical protein
MDSEDTIFREFKDYNLKYLDAIERMQAIGHSSIEAERIVSEWADGLEADQEWKAQQ